MSDAIDFWLASGSPRRRELLDQLGYRFATLTSAVDESPRRGEGAAALARRLARAKAAAGWAAAPARRRRPALGADTVVVLGGELLGKPADRADGERMLAALAGKEHEVLTAVAVTDGGVMRVGLSCSRVRMRRIPRAEIRAYWETGEPRDKAGGYAVQGFAAAFITRIEGSYSGIMGLPLCETAALLARFGVHGRLRPGECR